MTKSGHEKLKQATEHTGAALRGRAMSALVLEGDGHYAGCPRGRVGGCTCARMDADDASPAAVSTVAPRHRWSDGRRERHCLNEGCPWRQRPKTYSQKTRGRAAVAREFSRDGSEWTVITPTPECEGRQP